MNDDPFEPDEKMKSQNGRDPEMGMNDGSSDFDDDEYEGEEAWDEDDEEPDPMDDYGSSGQKYGWYNGFSDDVIDDAFEGDPEATWNVD